MSDAAAHPEPVTPSAGSSGTAPARRRVALVTGAVGGIGRAIAVKLLAQGFELALLDRLPLPDAQHQALQEAAGPDQRVQGIAVDLADAEATRAAVRQIEAHWGAVDVLVNNAGLTANLAPLTRISDADWDHELAINLTAPRVLIQAVLPGMQARGYGRIVNVSSVAARGGLFWQAGYSATKAGLLGLTRNVTLEHARHGITCNAILPGLIETPAVQQMPDEIRRDALSLTPARRLGQPAEVAALIAFLCSEDAGFINGAEIDIDGGGRLCPMVLGSRREVAERQAFAAGR